MKATRLMPPLLMPLLILTACHDQDGQASETPEAMYEHARALLMPAVSRETADVAGALEWMRKSAEAGYLRAQLDLGGLYMYGGKGIEKDAGKALAWFSRAVDQGFIEAETSIGDILYRGEGVARDVQGALAHWRRAAEAGVADAQFRLGDFLMQSEATLAEGRQWLTKAAESGFVDAQIQLGQLLLRSEETAAEGLAWLAKAADAGCAEARYRLGLALIHGGKAEDAPRGLELLTQAADDTAGNGLKDAARNLGFIYANGYAGVRRDLSEAARWYRLAAEKGDSRAQMVYGLMLINGEGVAVDFDRGVNYIRLAAGQDLPAAIRLLIGLLESSPQASDFSAEIEAWKARLSRLEGADSGEPAAAESTKAEAQD